jgi:hypothetical protein
VTPTRSRRDLARWLLGIAGAVIMALASLGASAQLRRLDALEARVHELERQVTRLEALGEAAPPMAEILRERRR